MLYIFYQDFIAKNEANKQNYKNAVKTGQFNPNLPGADPYMSVTIERVDMNNGDGAAEIKSSYRNAYTNVFIRDLVGYVLNSDVIHVTNPSKIKGWRYFD